MKARILPGVILVVALVWPAAAMAQVSGGIKAGVNFAKVSIDNESPGAGPIRSNGRMSVWWLVRAIAF
jgi:hypothetical protein